MTRDLAFDLAEAARARAEDIQRRGAHVRFLATINPRQAPRKANTLNVAFDRIRREIRA